MTALGGAHDDDQIRHLRQKRADIFHMCCEFPPKNALCCAMGQEAV